MKHWGSWTAFWRVFVRGEREWEPDAVKRLLRARCRLVFGSVSVARGCQNLSISPYWSRFQVIDRRESECAFCPYLIGIF